VVPRGAFSATGSGTPVTSTRVVPSSTATDERPASENNPLNRQEFIVAKQNPYRILLVDDEPGIRKILKLFLELEGYTVFEAITANQAMQVVKKERPHLIILDVILFGQSGFDVCEWVKNNPETKDIIIFLFTALNQETRLPRRTAPRVRPVSYQTAEPEGYRGKSPGVFADERQCASGIVTGTALSNTKSQAVFQPAHV